MTYEEAARILDPETSREALLPYAYDPQYQQMLLRKACVIAANVLESYAALTVSCPEGDLIMPGGETFEAKFLSLPRVSYEPLRPADAMPVNRIKIQYDGEELTVQELCNRLEKVENEKKMAINDLRVCSIENFMECQYCLCKTARSFCWDCTDGSNWKYRGERED